MDIKKGEIVMKNQKLCPYLTLLSMETVDAGLFIKAKGTVKNMLPRPIPVIRYQIEVSDAAGKVLGYQIGEILNLKPFEVRKFELPAQYDQAKRVKIVKMLGFQK